MHVCSEGAVVQPAQKRPLTEEEIRRRLMKTGGTPFEFDQLEIFLEEDCYMTVQELNRFRREALDTVERAVLTPFRRQQPSILQSSNDSRKREKRPVSISVLASSRAQVLAASKVDGISRIYFNYEGNDNLAVEAAAMTHGAGKEFYLAMPYILRNDTKKQCLSKIQKLKSTTDGFLVRNMETLLMLRKAGFDQPCISDYNMYCMNDRAGRVYEQMMDQMTLPVELNRREIAGLRSAVNSEMIVYGYQPLMVSAQCLMKTTGKCTKEPGYYELEDRRHKKFLVHNVCAFCYNLIYNSVPLYLMDVLDEATESGIGGVRLQFVNETGDTVRAMAEACIRALQGERVTAAGDFTKGHYKRGVE